VAAVVPLGYAAGEAAGVAATAVGSPVPLAQKPNALTDAPGAMLAAHAGGVTVTAPVCWLAVPFHESRMLVPDGSVKASRHPDTCVVPVLRTVKLRHRPVSHVESRVTDTASDPVTGAGVGVGVGVGVAEGVPGTGPVPGTGVGVGVGVGAGLGAGAPAMLTVTALSDPEPCTQSPVSW